MIHISVEHRRYLPYDPPILGRIRNVLEEYGRSNTITTKQNERRADVEIWSTVREKIIIREISQPKSKIVEIERRIGKEFCTAMFCLLALVNYLCEQVCKKGFLYSSSIERKRYIVA